MKGYHYQHRVSILDDMDEHSALSKSKTKGFYYYAHMLGMFYIFDLIYFGKFFPLIENSPTV